ncbi:hypothetical protein Tsubulata_043004, partial [Turnera subulata]
LLSPPPLGEAAIETRAPSWRLNMDQFQLPERNVDTHFSIPKVLNTLRRQKQIAEYYKKQVRLLEGFNEVDSFTELGVLPGGLSEEDQKQLAKSEKIAIYASNIANFVLFVAKIYASVTSKSMAVIASTVDSLLDLLSGFILWFTDNAMRKQNQYQYPIGKQRMQPVGIVVFASVMATLGLQILFESGRQLITKIALYTVSNWSGTVMENVWSLVGRTAPPEYLAKLTYLIWNHHEEIKHIDTIRAYTFGCNYFVEADIVLPQDMSLCQAHNIGEALQEKIEQLPEVERAFIVSWSYPIHLASRCRVILKGSGSNSGKNAALDCGEEPLSLATMATTKEHSEGKEDSLPWRLHLDSFRIPRKDIDHDHQACPSFLHSSKRESRDYYMLVISMAKESISISSDAGGGGVGEAEDCSSPRAQLLPDSAWRLDIDRFRLPERKRRQNEDQDQDNDGGGGGGDDDHPGNPRRVPRFFLSRLLPASRKQRKVSEYYKKQERLLEGYHEMEAMTESGCFPETPTEV